MLSLLLLILAPAAVISQPWSHITRFNALGPFPVGKTEFDADPVVARGGALALHSNTTTRIPSELATGGYVQWNKQTATDGGWVSVQWPGVDWNRIVQAMGGLEAAEFQAWFVGSFRVYASGQHQLDCPGVHSLHLDGSLYSGDVYGTGKMLASMNLAAGRRWISFKLRGQGSARFRCSFRSAPPKPLTIWPPSMTPDLFGGAVFGSGLFSIPVHNSDAGWLSALDVKVAGAGSVAGIAVSLAAEWPLVIAPGVTTALPLKIHLPAQDDLNVERKKCVWFKLHLSGQLPHSDTRTGVGIKIELNCRHTAQSFLFSFWDNDGSVSYAAAIRPHGTCPQSGGCAVLLSLSGVGATPMSQADSHKFKRDKAKDFTYGMSDAWTLAPERCVEWCCLCAV
jgi:hypothetical protein